MPASQSVNRPGCDAGCNAPYAATRWLGGIVAVESDGDGVVPVDRCDRVPTCSTASPSASRLESCSATICAYWPRARESSVPTPAWGVFVLLVDPAAPFVAWQYD